MDITQKVNLALEYRNEGKFIKAEKIYLDILDGDPQNSVILSFLGVIYYEMNKFKKAEKYLKKAYEIKPDNVNIKMLALTYYRLGKAVEAREFLTKCAEFDKSPEIYNKLINIIIMGNTNYNKAYPYSLDLYKRFPFDVENIVNLSEICLYSGKFKDSINYCNKALALDDKYGKAWIQRGLIEEVLNYDDEKARECFRKALKLGWKREAYYNLCINYSHDDCKKSNYYGKHLLKMGQVNNSNKINLTIGANYLAMKKMKEGYKYYAHRWNNIPKSECSSANLKKIWNGKTYKDETLFILCDMGYGDKIMFIRYLPYVAKKFKQVKVMCSSNLYKIFSYSYSHLKNVTFYKYSKNFPRYDKSISVLYLPMVLNMGFNKIPYQSGYLKAPPEKIEEYRKYFNTDKLKVGICWEAGATVWREQIERTLNITLFEPLFKLENVQFYSFQVNPSMDNYKKYDNLINLGATFKDFNDTAGALMNLDILVTVDTSIAHLAGALGVKTFLLLPRHSDWRWFANIEKTEWYDSIKIFKQTNKKSWEKEIGDICRNIQRHI